MMTQRNLVPLIVENDAVYSYLLQYYLDWISDQAFEDYAKTECEKGKSIRQIHAEYFDAWISWEPYADELIEKIQALSTIV